MPIVVSIIDTLSQIQRWFRVINRITDRTGLVTAEDVPVLEMAGASESGASHWHSRP